MVTLLDAWDSFMSKYVRRSEEPEFDEPKTDPAFQQSNYDTANRKFSADNLTQEKRRKLALTAPFYMKGIKKKGLDTFRAWHKFEKISNGNAPSVLDQTIIDIFNKKAKTKVKFTEADKCSHMYGDGFLLIKYKNDNKSGESGSPDLSLKPNIKKSGAEPFDLMVLDPERIDGFQWKSEYYKSKNIMHLHYKTKSGNERYIHPDRILQIPRNKLPFSKLGVSDIDILIDVINSYSDINIATGEILKWFSHGIISVTKQNMGSNERKDILKELAKHNNIYANDDRYKFDIITPEAINPKEFYAWIIQNIAAILVMPTHLLMGIQVGRVTGAEIGFSDYYRDVKDDQDILYTPLFEKLYGQLLASRGRDFIYNIIWNEIYISELAEAEIDVKRSEAIEKLVDKGVIDTAEAREKHNKGHVELDVNKKIKKAKIKDDIGDGNRDRESDFDK